MKTRGFSDTPWHGEYLRFRENPQYAHCKTKKELSNLVSRVIGEQWRDRFDFRQLDIRSANGNDAFEIFEEDGRIVVCGRNGVAMASGFNYYLKHFAKST